MEKKLIKITDLIKTGWDSYVHNFDKFLLPIIIMLIIPVLSLGFEYFNYYNIIIIILIVAISIFISLWISIVLILITDKLYKKENFDVNQLYREAFSKIPSYLWVSVLVFLVVLGGFFLLIIPAILFAIWFEFAPYINVLENKNNKGLQALRTSKSLVKGRWWPTFWRLLVPPLFIYVIVVIIIGALTYVLSGGNLDLISPNSQSNLILNSLTTLILTILTPLFLTFVIILYNNLKATKQNPTETEKTNE